MGNFLTTRFATSFEDSNSKWIYSAALRRVRQLVPVDICQHFLDTDFTYADLGFVGLQGTYRLLSEEERAGVRTYKIEEGVPRERAYYSRIITWVAVDSMIPLQRDYYDVGGTLWKTEVFDNVGTTDGVLTPLHIKMEDVQEWSITELTLEQVRYDADIPDTLFDSTQLPRVAELPLWQAYLSPAAGKP